MARGPDNHLQANAVSAQIIKGRLQDGKTVPCQIKGLEMLHSLYQG